MSLEKIKIKITFIGPAEAGKTSLINRVVYGNYNFVYEPTVGSDFLNKTFQGAGDEATTIKAQLWDTAGQERFLRLLPSNLNDVSAIAIVLSPEDPNPDTEKRLKPLEYLQREANKYYPYASQGDLAQVPTYFIINKSDLFQDLDLSEESIKEALSSADEDKILFCSAKTGTDVERAKVKTAFETIAKGGCAYLKDCNFTPPPSSPSGPPSSSSSGPLGLNLGVWGGGNIVLAIAAIGTIATLASIPTGGIPLLAGLTVLGVAGIVVGAALLLWNLGCFIANQVKGGGGEPSTKGEDLEKDWSLTGGGPPTSKTQPKSEEYRKLNSNDPPSTSTANRTGQPPAGQHPADKKIG